MNEVRDYLQERKEEVNVHLQLLATLENRSIEVKKTDDNMNIDVRQVLILKSSILVHLYNVIESTMAKCLESIESAVHNYHPKDYSEKVFVKWVNRSIRISKEFNQSRINQRAQKMSKELLAISGWSNFVIQKVNGNWDDKKIENCIKELDISIIFPRGFKPKVKRHYFNDLTCMEYIRMRRNDLAHGAITFETGADSKTHAELVYLADLSIEYMGLVINACNEYVSRSGFLKNVA